MSARAKTGLVALALAVLAGVGAMVVVSVTGDESEPIASVPGGDPERGADLIEQYGCDTCHTIAGIDSTDKYIGPPLIDFAERRYIAGDEPNGSHVGLFRRSAGVSWRARPPNRRPACIFGAPAHPVATVCGAAARAVGDALGQPEDRPSITSAPTKAGHPI